MFFAGLFSICRSFSCTVSILNLRTDSWICSLPTHCSRSDTSPAKPREDTRMLKFDLDRDEKFRSKSGRRYPHAGLVAPVRLDSRGCFGGSGTGVRFAKLYPRPGSGSVRAGI